MEPRKMALLAQLLWGRREQKDTANLAGKLVDQLILRAGAFPRSGQMMGFIDDQDVPVSRHGLRHAFWVMREQAGRANDQLIVEKRVGFGISRFDRIAAFLIENREPKVKPSQEFDEPLMNERFGDHDQYPPRAPGHEQAMQD